MAQTAQLVHELAAGVVDSTGTVVSSGNARFYQPGTTTLLVTGVWSDATATTPLSQPVVLSAGGTATVYLTVPARMILKKSDDATTVLDVNNVDAQLAGAVYIKNAAVNAGAETTLDAYLASTATSSAYLESSGATSRSIVSRLQDQEVSLKDFNAVGDGVTDDTVVIQAALDHCGATGKDLLIPAATFLISGALTLSSYTKKFNIRGCGAKSSIIKQSSTSANALTISYGGSTDWGAEIRGVGFTCSTTSSGAAVSVSNANNIALRDCEFALFRTAVSASGATGVVAERCNVLSSDGNAAAVGIVTGSGGRLFVCQATGSSNLGTGFQVGADSHIRDCSASGWATQVSCSAADVRVSGGKYTGTSTTNGVVLSGDNAVADGVYVTGAALGVQISGQFGRISTCSAVSIPASCTGFSVSGVYGTISGSSASAASTTSTTGHLLNAAGGVVMGSYATGCNTGVSIGAVADCRAFGNSLVTNTTDISINGSATNYSVFANKEASNLPQYLHSSGRMNMGVTTTAVSAVATVTPVAMGTGPWCTNRYDVSGTAYTMTIGATATTGLLSGDTLELSIANSVGTVTLAWNAQYKASDGTSTPNITGGTFNSIAANKSYAIRFYWTGSVWRQLWSITV